MSIAERIRKYTKLTLNRLEIKFAIKSGVAATLSWMIGVWVATTFERPDKLVSGLWCVISAIIVLQTRLGGTYKEGWDRFIGILIGSLMGGLFTSYVGVDPVSLGYAVASTIVIMALFKMQDSFKIATLSAAVVMILYGLNPDVSPWDFAFHRFSDSLVGIIIGLAVAHLFWSSETSKQLRTNHSRILHYFRELFPTIFVPKSLDLPLSTDPVELFEQIGDLIDENRLLMDELRLEWTGGWNSAEGWSLFHNVVRRILDEMVACHQINKDRWMQMFDAPLTHATLDAVSIGSSRFAQISNWLETGVSPQKIPSLETTIEELEQELNRFRDTRETVKFNLEEVEHYFVYFHNLEAILKNLLKLEELIPNYKLTP